MRVVHFIIAGFLLFVFLRRDMQLGDLILDTNLIWAGAAALFLTGLMIGRYSAAKKEDRNTVKLAGWGLFVCIILGLVEYTTEWRQSSVLRQNQQVILSAAAVEPVVEHIIRAQDGLFRTKAQINGVPIPAMLDTGASVVLLTYEAARKTGIDVDNLEFTVPVVTASGPLQIAKVTLDTVKVGQILLRDVEAAVSPKGQQHSNLLGTSFLSRLKSAEFSDTRVILKKR
ncbi:MAG: TIGR02281 family clan AA aspartic protease [Rhodobacteraceae bacterium]|nr:TIGR02281 family clan AA aspartic protease [Paracoccaceae bacterium]